MLTSNAENIYDNCPIQPDDESTASEVTPGRLDEQGELDLPLSEIQFHQHNVWVPANPYLTERIPNWLYIYSRAPIELDSQLKWNLFSEEELHFYLAMINRLYKEEAQELVLGYEAFRVVLQKEIERRESTEPSNIYNNVASIDSRNPDDDNIYNNVNSNNNVFESQISQASSNKSDHHHYSNIADLSKELTTVKSNVW